MRSERWEETRRMARGIWLIGLGLMLLRHQLWPDILILVGSVRLFESLRHPERRRSLRAGVILIGAGLLLTWHASLVEILLVAGLYFVCEPLLRVPSNGKPAFDARLE